MAQRNPWDPLPELPSGDAMDTTTYAAVGRALSIWEGLEVYLAMMFGALCETREEGAQRAYGVVASFSGRSDMLLEAFACFRREEEKAKIATFPKLVDRIGKFSARRNEIAHGIVSAVTNGGRSLGLYLCAPMYNSRKSYSFAAWRETAPARSVSVSPLSKYAYTAAQIDYYSGQFGALTNEVAAALAALLEERLKREFPEGVPEQPGA